MMGPGARSWGAGGGGGTYNGAVGPQSLHGTAPCVQVTGLHEFLSPTQGNLNLLGSSDFQMLPARASWELTSRSRPLGLPQVLPIWP